MAYNCSLFARLLKSEIGIFSLFRPKLDKWKVNEGNLYWCLNMNSVKHCSLAAKRNFTKSYTSSAASYQQSSMLEKKNNDDHLKLSDSCVARLKEIIDSKEDKFLRVQIEGGGCSGFQYKFDLDSTLMDEDRVFERDGVKIVIDETSLEYVKGSTIDYHVELIRSAFRIINNPLAESGCSCGASFSIKI